MSSEDWETESLPKPKRQARRKSSSQVINILIDNNQNHLTYKELCSGWLHEQSLSVSVCAVV